MRFSRFRPVAWLLCQFVLVILNACNLAKHLPANERLYTGTDIVLRADSTVSGDEQTAIREQLQTLARPQPNAQIFGYPWKVGAYYLFGEPRKPKGFRAWFRRKLGEEPVFASAKAIKSSIPIWEASLQNDGYFDSQVSGELKESGYKARGVYQVDVKPRFYIDSVAFYTDDSVAAVRATLQNRISRRNGRRPTASAPQRNFSSIQQALTVAGERTIIKKGNPYSLANIKLERERIGQFIKQRSFYYFLADYVGVLADNDSAAHRTTLIFYIKPDMPMAAGVPYTIRDVFIYPNYNLSTARQDTNQRRAYETEQQFNIVDSSRRFDPKLFRDVITVRPGEPYSSRQQDLTLSRLVNIGAFKFVRNRFEPIAQGDSALLDVHYYLTPQPTKSARVELDGTSRSNNFAGTQVTVSWRDCNALRRAELLTLNANAGIEAQLGLNSQERVTNYRFGLEAILSFPRLVSPLSFRYDQRQALPKTNVTMGYQTIIRGGLYRINSFNTTFGYAWRQNQRVEHVFQPFNANYIYVPLSKVGERFYDVLLDPDIPSIIKRQYQSILTSDQLILSTLYTFNYNSSIRNNQPTSVRLTGNAEIAGNVASIFFHQPVINDERKGIFGVPYAQYLRLDADVRVYRTVSKSITWVNRMFAGLGLPYGNSRGFTIPLTRQYFVGGSNSIRAFRPRAIGPGLYTRDTLRNVPSYQDGGGDIKLEANTELRAKFNKYVEGALFFDAGNIWTYYPSEQFTVDAQDGQFRRDFYKQIALGTGVGLRFDAAGYFLIRFDLGMPLRKPYKTNGNEWVIDQINFRDRDWRRQNLIFNIGVGYPF